MITRLIFDQLSKKIGRSWILKDISLSISKHELFGFVGPNGSGKTTLLKIISGFASPTHGTLTFETKQGSFSPKPSLCFLFDVPPFYEHLSLLENIELINRTHFLPHLDMDKLNQVAESLSIASALKKKVRKLSLGTRKKANILLLSLFPYELALLDEPTNSLDPPAVEILTRLLQNLKKEKLIVLTSHDLAFAQAVCDRVGLLYQGRLVSTRSLQEERTIYGNQFVLSLNGLGQNIALWLEQNHLAEVVFQQDGKLTLRPRVDRSLLLAQLLQNRWDVKEFYEDTFDLSLLYRKEMTRFINSPEP